jgi:hypothetical protein
MGRDPWCSRQERSMKGCGRKGRDMGMGSIIMLLEDTSKDIEWIISRKASVRYGWLMVITMKVNGKLARDKVKVYISIQMGISTRVNSLITRRMVLAGMN